MVKNKPGGAYGIHYFYKGKGISKIFIEIIKHKW